MGLCVNFVADLVDLLLDPGVDLKDYNDYDEARYDDRSPFNVGDNGPWVKTYQEWLDCVVTGVWDQEDEKAYEIYRDKINWTILMNIIDLPSTWEAFIPHDDDVLLNLEF